MDYHQFKKLVQEKGCSIVTTTKHHKIIDAKGVTIMNMAITHQKGAKRYVKGVYVKEFLNYLERKQDE